MASSDTSATAVTSSSPAIPRNTLGTIAPAPVATPTFGPGGSFTICCSARIAAPADHVLAVLLEHARWPDWNRFVPRVTIDSRPEDDGGDGDGEGKGSSTSSSSSAVPERLRGPEYLAKGVAMTFEVHMDPGNATSYRNEGIAVTLLEPFDAGAGAGGGSGSGSARRGWRVAWRPTGYPSFVLRSERVQELVDDGEGATEYTCWETMYGPLAPVVRLAVGGQLEKAFQCWSDDLKARAEGKADHNNKAAASAAA